MTSNMLTGEKRWASARRSGMTVLGKVAVPKPLNLPSQRSENHGLDPNVEIVPKGTLSWGTRSSSSGSNAWGSLTPSPNTDGGTGSPSHISGRPSSGGSGTRPSTAGSDKAYESTANAWGPNSRPSSASGALTTNQTSLTSLRPRSAEPRPSSSQLSRFAEPLSENSVAWGGVGTAEKLGVASSKENEFSLASGDFPTLGSEKNDSGKITESQDHGFYSRPSSSSGGVASARESSRPSSAGDASANANFKNGTINSWKRESSYVEDGGIRPGVEKWQGDPQPYPSANIPPQHFDPWRGPPMGAAPGGVWFRGPPVGSPYGTPVAPGGFPMEPFPYFRPQVPATALAGSQPAPSPVSGPRGHHLKNGDLYRPHMPDAFIQPNVPLRPGFCHGPMPYEGYYAPPMGYCNPNGRDISFMGMPAGPPVYDMYSSQNSPDPSHSRGHFHGYGSTGKALVSEHVESAHPHDTRVPSKVLLKQHNGWNGKDDEQNWEHSVTVNPSYNEKGGLRRISSWDNDVDEESIRATLGEESSSQTFDNQEGCSSGPGKQNLPECVADLKAVENSTKTLENAKSASEMPQPFPVNPKDPALIRKIEGLNAKARAADGRHDNSLVSSREEQKNSLHGINSKANLSTNDIDAGAAYFERTHANGIVFLASNEMGGDTGEKHLEAVSTAGTTISRRVIHGIQSRVDYRGKPKSNTQEADGWRKKSLMTDSSNVDLAANVETSSIPVQDHHTLVDATERHRSNFHVKDERESAVPMFDPSDGQEQRAKRRELAKQRAKQLQKEEEERTKEQKAKALAKLEELNRRSQAVEASNQKLDDVATGSAALVKLGESKALVEPNASASKFGPPSSEPILNSNVVARTSESRKNGLGETTILSKELTPEAAMNAPHEEPGGTRNQSLPLSRDVNNADTTIGHAAQVHDNNVSKQKRMGYKQKQNSVLEKNLSEMSIFTSFAEAPGSHATVEASVSVSVEHVKHEISSSCESSLPISRTVMADSSVHQRRKNNRGGKNKQRLEETTSMAVLPSPVLKETNIVKPSAGSAKPEFSEAELDHSLIELQTNSKETVQPSELRSSLHGEEIHGRVNSQWKSQHSRRMPRNPQANKSTEKFHNSDGVVWAPVQSQNKTEVAVEASHRTVESATPSKSDLLAQNSPKSKRAEMERYVPKPAAKELAQQGSIQQPVSQFSHRSNETTGRVESGTQSPENTQLAGSVAGKTGLSGESKHGDNKQNKQGKGHGSWRQRVSTEATRVQNFQDESSSVSDPNKKVQRFVEHHQTLKPEVPLTKEQAKYSDELNFNDGWNTSEPVAPVTSPVVKDLGAMSRGKRHHMFKRDKSTPNNHALDHKNSNIGDAVKTCSQSPAVDMCQADRSAAMKETRGAGERSISHWQPKSQVNSAQHQRGGRSCVGQSANIEVRKVVKELTPHIGVQILPQLDKETEEITIEHHHGLPISEDNVVETPNVGHQDPRRDRRGTLHKGRPHSPNQGCASPVESASANADTRPEQRLSSGFRKGGNQNSRFGRGHESRGEWSSSGQNNRQYNLPANRERQRHNSHFEYQPVGPYQNNKSNSSEGPADGSHITSSRPRERGHNHQRRDGGNFYGQQSGTVQVDSGYD